MEYIWQISFPLFSFLFEMNCRLAASNVWHSFSFSLLGLNPNTNLNFTSSALFVNILAVAAKCFPKAHKTQNPKGKHCLAAIEFAFYHLWVASSMQSCWVDQSTPCPQFPPHILLGGWSREVPQEGCVCHVASTSPSCHCFPRAAWAAHHKTISSSTAQSCWARQAVKCHYTRATDSKDLFRLPWWAVSGTNSF